MLLAEKGNNPPSYAHTNINTAIEEAKRLQKLLGGKVKILQVIGEVKEIEIPVTRKEVIVIIENNNDLPF